jgi:ribosomal protein S18 acetylase RimI-like enzyme
MQAGRTEKYRLRAVGPADSEELFRIHCDAMGDHLRRAVPGWSEATDREHHDKWMRQGSAKVIVVGDRIVGLLEVVRGDAALWLLRLELDSAVHGRGLGSAVIRDLQQQARDERLGLELDVFPHNPARRLYERLGFREVGRDGSSIKMRWDPPEGSGLLHVDET